MTNKTTRTRGTKTKQSTKSKKTAKRGQLDDSTAAYCEGCREGEGMALKWIEDRKKDTEIIALKMGTLQHPMLAFVEGYAKARGPVKKNRIRGQVVGFCTTLEFPGYKLQRRADAALSKLVASMEGKS